MRSTEPTLHKARGFIRPFTGRLCTAILFFTMILIQSCEKLLDYIPRDEPGNKTLDLALVADGFTSPLRVVPVPNNTRNLFVIDQIGKIWILDKNGTRLPAPFLDITSKLVTLNPNNDERGLLGFAFHPEYSKNGRFFVYYNAPPRPGGPQQGLNWNNLSRIAEYRVSSLNPNQADMNSEKIILEWDDPQSNHNGGTIEFGPTDGYLYIAIGDGGSANDVAPGHVDDWYPVNAGGNGQDVDANLFGNILRIDIDRGNPYQNPTDNPFVGRQGRDEIYAYGLRNPWSFSFDMKGSHQLIAMDAGQVLYEEINLITKGGNYGWNVKEGRHCFNAASNRTTLPSCPGVDVFGNPLVDPVIELNNTANPAGGKAITIVGGNVYRGAIKSLWGKYIFGTLSQTFNPPTGELFWANPSGTNWQYEELNLKSFPNDVGHYVKGFGQDLAGEVYVAASGSIGPSGSLGKIFKIVEVDK